MIDYETFCQLKALQKKGLSARQSARELHLDRATTSRWYKRERYVPVSASSSERTGKLAAFKGTIARLLESHPYSARQLLHKLREQGYDGGYSILCKHVQAVRPSTHQAYLQLHFAPGQCAQVDFGHAGYVTVGNTRRALSFLVVVLGYSRWMHVEFTLGQSQEWFLEAQQRAFQRLGGVPQQVMVDNCKSAILSHPRGERAVPHPRYLDFAHHYGFEIKACAVRQPQSKGMVENAVGYVKKNFLFGRELTDLARMNASARRWLDEVANVRLHGHTRQKPVDLLVEEKKHLQPLAQRSYDVSTIRTVRASSRCRVQLDANRYSVPSRYAGQMLTAHLAPEKLRLYDGTAQLVCEHPRSYERGRDFEDPAHTQALREQRHRARHQIQLERFLALGSAAKTYHQGLSERCLNWRSHVEKILALEIIHGRDALLRALTDAGELSAFSSDYIALLLEQRHRILPQAAPLHLTRSSDLLQLELPTPDLTPYH